MVVTTVEVHGQDLTIVVSTENKLAGKKKDNYLINVIMIYWIFSACMHAC